MPVSTTLQEAAQAAVILNAVGVLRFLLIVAKRSYLKWRTARSLEALSDAGLKDIGLSRSAIPFMADLVKLRGTDSTL